MCVESVFYRLSFSRCAVIFADLAVYISAYICSAQYWNKYNSRIALRIIGIPILLRYIGIPKMRRAVLEFTYVQCWNGDTVGIIVIEMRRKSFRFVENTVVTDVHYESL